MMEKIGVKKLREGAVLPTFGSDQAAGADLYACLEEVGYNGLLGYELFPKMDTSTAVRAIMSD